MNGRDLIELVRAPAALTVVGDSLAGGARTPWPPLASVCLYWAGMALNDYADRELDAKERPERPIPSGRVRPGHALGIAVGLTGAGIALAAVNGRARVAVPLAAVVWAYDLKLKGTPLGPVAMAAARGLDVLMGGARPEAVAAVAAHTYGVTVLSRGEVHGGGQGEVRVALAASSGAVALAGGGGLWRLRRESESGLVAGYAAAYAGTVGGAQMRVARDPNAGNVRAAVGAGILGLLPLQAALVAGQRRPVAAAGLAGLHPLARMLARKVSPT